MKSKLIIAALIVGILLFAGASQLLDIYGTVDVVGHSYKNKGIWGGSIEAGAPHDIFDSTRYVSSWDDGDFSEKIVLWPEAGVYSGGPYGVVLGGNWIVLTFSHTVTISVNGYTFKGITSWKSPIDGNNTWIQPWGSSGWADLRGYIVYIVGPWVGNMRAELWAYHGWIDWGIFRSDYNMIASDEAKVVSGVGSVTAPVSPTEELQTAHFKVTTGYSHTVNDPTKGGWVFEIHYPSDRGGGLVSGTQVTVPDNVVSKDIAWTVPRGMYSSTQSNSFSAVLRNELFEQSRAYAFVIDIGGTVKIPNSPVITSLSGNPPYLAGQVISFIIGATQNPLGDTVIGFEVWVSYSGNAPGQTGPYVIEDQFYPATLVGDNYTATVQFTVQQGGYYLIQASTVDSAHRNSPMTALNVATTTPGGGGGNNEGEWNYGLLAIGIAAIIIGLLVGLILIMYVPPPIGLIIGLLVIIAGLVIGGYELYQFFIDAQEKGLMLIQQMLSWRR